MERILLSELISRDVLQELQDACSSYSGMAALVSDANGVPVTEGSGFSRFCRDLTKKSKCGAQNCERCRRQGAMMMIKTGQAAVYECHAGLMDYSAPILLNGEFIGSFSGGQVRTGEVNEEAVRKKAEEYDIDPDEYVKAAKETRLVPLEQIEKTAQFLADIAAVLSQMAYQRYQLLEQKQMIEQNTRMQADFLKQYSMDLKHDLHEITGFLTQVAASSEEMKNGAEVAAMSESMAENMRRHVSSLDDTIDYMEIESDDFTLDETLYDIRWVTAMKINELRNTAVEHQDELSYLIDDGVPRQLVGDPARIGGIIGKCIENSVKYTSGNKIHVAIRTEKQGYGTMLEIKVSDKGVGMDPEARAKIESYMRSRGESTNREEEYEMLGFASIGYAVNAMSGSIDIRSKLGYGTEFIFTIPQLEA